MTWSADQGICCFISLPDSRSTEFIGELIRHFSDDDHDLILGFVGFNNLEEKEYKKYEVEILKRSAGYKFGYVGFDPGIKVLFERMMKGLFTPVINGVKAYRMSGEMRDHFIRNYLAKLKRARGTIWDLGVYRNDSPVMECHDDLTAITFYDENEINAGFLDKMIDRNILANYAITEKAPENFICPGCGRPSIDQYLVVAKNFTPSGDNFVCGRCYNKISVTI
ncbi:MAG: hypothetical protein HQL30_02950 [Candidatus Omnitrophica bacterium]|nr:hypothetical protein [Candidatus Omnitrophota bacterium]